MTPMYVFFFSMAIAFFDLRHPFLITAWSGGSLCGIAAGARRQRSGLSQGSELTRLGGDPLDPPDPYEQRGDPEPLVLTSFCCGKYGGTIWKIFSRFTR